VSSSQKPPWERPVSRRDALRGAGFLAIGAGLAACGSSGSSSSSSSAATSAAAGSTAAGGPKKGGNLRVGTSGSGPKDIIDGQNIVGKADQCRLVAGWETLLTYDRDYKLSNDGLAEEVTAEAPDSYVIRVHDGVEFHNGKTLSADDVIYSLQRLVDPKLGLFGGAALASVDPKGLTKVDARTVRMKLKQPDSTIPDSLAQYVAGIVPVGYTSKGTSMATGQIGTGPFTLQSFEPGKQSVHPKFANYWKTGKPYVDQVTIIDIDEATARVNALVSNQIDACIDVPFAQIPIVKGNSSLVLFENEGGGWLPICMTIDQDPFTDARVRQAMRLIVDRDQMVAQAFSGHARVANDLYGIFDPCYATDLPQRKQDLEQAKSLLKAAGKEGLTVELVTSDVATGVNDMCKVFAQQAKGAGVNVKLKIVDSATFFGDQYLKWTFSPDFWGTRGYLNQVAAGSLPKSPYNETHWPPKGSNFEALYNQALAETDATKRCAIIHQMMQLEYDQGGYIISAFQNLIDGYSSKLTGFQKNRGTLNLDSYGHNWAEVSFT
jgi:peptide/nickel transport system substrate-binding protein